MESYRYREAWAIVLIVLAAMGMIIDVFTHSVPAASIWGLLIISQIFNATNVIVLEINNNQQ